MTGHPFHLASDGLYRCAAFDEFAWQQHGFGTRQANPRADITLRQIHSDLALNAAGLKDRERQGDALITDEIGTSIGIRTADCVPILLVDSRRRVVAAVHAGWRGAAAGIVHRAIEKMRADFATSPQDIYAALGPAIRACCYEVGPDVAAHFNKLFPEWKSAGVPRTLDLAEANRRQLESAGVAPARIFDSGLCTACQAGEFFSYRREPETPGRMIAAICRLA